MFCYHTYFLKQQGDSQCSSHCPSRNGSHCAADNKESVKECILCGSKDNQQSRYDSWGKMECVYLEKHLGVSPHNQCFICKKHLVEARRHGHELDHIPSWKSSSNDLQSSKQQCSNPHCNNSECDKLIKAMFTTSDKLSKLFGLEPTGEPFVLCRKCYNETYATICGSQSKPCSSCGANQREELLFADIAQTLIKCHITYQTRLGRM